MFFLQTWIATSISSKGTRQLREPQSPSWSCGCRSCSSRNSSVVPCCSPFFVEKLWGMSNSRGFEGGQKREDHTASIIQHGSFFKWMALLLPLVSNVIVFHTSWMWSGTYKLVVSNWGLGHSFEVAVQVHLTVRNPRPRNWTRPQMCFLWEFTEKNIEKKPRMKLGHLPRTIDQKRSKKTVDGLRSCN